MKIGIGFDIDHTLLIDNKLERIAFLRLLEHIIETGGIPLGTLVEEQERIDQMLDIQRNAGRSIDDAVREFVEMHGVSPLASDYVERYKNMALALVDQVVIPMPGVREMLGELSARGIAVAVLSNGWNPLQERKVRRVGFEGTLLVSSEMGVQKPDARAFAILRTALGSACESVWYVGDDPSADIAGALASGFDAIWLDAEGKTYPAELPRPTRTVRALTEIPQLVS